MTKKDYETVARIILNVFIDYEQVDRKTLIDEAMYQIKRDNPRFDAKKFRKEIEDRDQKIRS